MKKILCMAIAAVAMMANAQSATFEDAFTAVANFGPGWNLGNTLDAHSAKVEDRWIETKNNGNPTSDDYETAWGQPKTTQALIQMFKEAGFNTIRVPVTWYPHLSDYNNGDAPTTWVNNTNFDLDAAWLARVKEVVGYVLDEGMYCILNTHHDSGGDNARWQYVDRNNEYANGLDRFSALWTKIATEFKDYNDHLIFEGYNEVLDTDINWNSTTNQGYAGINRYAAAFVTAVRGTGGNNANRNLILNTYAASNHEDAINHMVRPQGYENDQHLIYEVHAYPNKNGYESAFDWIFGNIRRRFVNQLNAPCLLGEWGCYEQTEGKHSGFGDAAFEEMGYYLSKRCKLEGSAAMLWMLLSNENDRSVPQWSSEFGGLKDAIIAGWNSPDCRVKFNGSSNANLIGDVNYSTTDINLVVENGGGASVTSSGINMNWQTITITAPKGYAFENVVATTADKHWVKYDGNQKSSREPYYFSTPSASFTLHAEGATITDLYMQLVLDPNFYKEYPNELMEAPSAFVGNMPANFIVNDNGYKANEIFLYDDSQKAAGNYTFASPISADKFTFERDYIDRMYWQPLYVPVEVPASVWSEFAQRVLEFTDVTTDGGETKLVYTDVAEDATLLANHPYIFLPNGSTKVEFSINGNVTVKEATDASVTHYGYTLHGTYSARTMGTNEYALWNGNFMRPDGSNVQLRPFRVYLTTTAQNAPQRIGIAIADPNQTGIENITTDAPADDAYYDLTGRRVADPRPGIYIRAGKKVLVR